MITCTRSVTHGPPRRLCLAPFGLSCKAAGRTAPARSAAERTWMYPERMRRPGGGKAHGPPRRQPGGKHRRLPRTHLVFSASKVGDRTSTHTARTHGERALLVIYKLIKKRSPSQTLAPPSPPALTSMLFPFFFFYKNCSLWFNLVHRLRRSTLTAAAGGGGKVSPFHSYQLNV